MWSDEHVSERASEPSAQSGSPGRTGAVETADGDPTDRDDPRELLRVAERVAVDAAAHLRDLPRPWEGGNGADRIGVTTKSTPTDVVTASDHAVETLVRDRLAVLRPGDTVLGEEHGGSAACLHLVSRTRWASCARSFAASSLDSAPSMPRRCSGMCAPGSAVPLNT